MIVFNRINLGSNQFPLWAYESEFNGRLRGVSFSKVRICNDLDGWSIRGNIEPGKMLVIDGGYQTLTEAKEAATSGKGQ